MSYTYTGVNLALLSVYILLLLLFLLLLFVRNDVVVWLSRSRRQKGQELRNAHALQCSNAKIKYERYPVLLAKISVDTRMAGTAPKIQNQHFEQDNTTKQHSTIFFLRNFDQT